MTTSQITAPSTPTRTAATGATLYFETVGAGGTGPGALRIRPDEDTLLRVISGTLRLTIGNVEQVLGPGAEAIIPAGRAHRMIGIGGQARSVMGFRAGSR